MAGTLPQDKPTGTAMLAAPFVLSLLFFYMSIFIPPLGIFTPAPLYYALVLHGTRIGVTLIAITSVFVYVVGGSGQAVFFLASSGLMAWTLAHAYMKKFSLEATISMATLIPWISGAVLFVALSYHTGAAPSESLLKWASSAMAAVTESYTRAGADPEMLHWFQANSDWMASFFVRIFISLTLISAFVAASANYAVVRAMSAKYGWGIVFPGHVFASWRAPEQMVWVVIVCSLLIMTGDGVVYSLALNIFLVTCAIYLAQGVAIIHFFFGKSQFGPLVRVFGYTLVFSQPLMIAIVCSAGFFDIWADFRRIQDKGESGLP